MKRKKAKEEIEVALGLVTKSKEEHTAAVLDHVLNSEADDFELNPSDNHVYYSAVSATEGELEARKMLAEAIKKSEG